jgi:polysaccharide biosynthesis protein PslG
MNSDKSPFGALAFLSWNHPWNENHFPLADVRRATQLMNEAGIGWVRMDFLWSDLEPEAGRFSFERYDQIVNVLRETGLNVLGVLHYNPGWRPGSWNQAPESDAYLRYAEAVVKHFQDSVHAWEIWNEPDHPVYWQPQDGLAAYASLLKRAYPVIKGANPNARVLMGGLSQQWPENIDKLYRLAGAGSFDIVNIHPFVSPLDLQAFETLQTQHQAILDVMQRHDDTKKPIWITEIGCPGVPSGLAVKDWWLGQNPTEAQQADWVEKIYSTLPRWKNVEKVFWAFFRDTPQHFKDGVDYFGLVREDFSKKPAFEVYRRIARMACQV